MRKVIIYILTLLTLLAAGCGSEQPQPKELQLCSSMGTKLTEVIADSYSKAAGVKVNISYLPGGTQQERLDYLRKHRFDVWLGGTSEEYFMADEQHILQPYIAKESYKVPAELRNRTGQWTSLYLSYIALLSNKNNLHAYGLYAPETWDELLAPQLKDELAIADFDLGGASFGMITSIWQMRGKEQAMAYAAKLNAGVYQGLRRGSRPCVYREKNRCYRAFGLCFADGSTSPPPVCDSGEGCQPYDAYRCSDYAQRRASRSGACLLRLSDE